MGPPRIQEGSQQNACQVVVSVYDAQGLHVDKVADGQPEEGMDTVVLREVVGVEAHVRELGEDVRGGHVAAMGECLHLGGDGRVGG